MTWELPPVAVICTWNFYYFMEINSSQLTMDWVYKDKVYIQACYFVFDLLRNKTYSVKLTAFNLSEKPVGSPWRKEITVIPSGKNSHSIYPVLYLH